MEMVEYHDYPAICAGVRSLKPKACRGILYRACDPAYANTRDLLTGEGSRKHGGRWNAPGIMAIVYLAQSWEGAMAETLGVASRYGFDPSARLPLTLVAVDAVLEAVVELADPQLCAMLKLFPDAIDQCDWRAENAAGREGLTQALGRAAFAAGFHGIIVPSAARCGLGNLNIFPDNLNNACKLSICRAEKLPPAITRIK